ncbi:hypothetical protein [Nannocystis pusilla]|uniref:hypothetical protein n=1 Tax=Nannocystis pusilla TaxID=889268 RepID=UPI003B7D7CC1
MIRRARASSPADGHFALPGILKACVVGPCSLSPSPSPAARTLPARPSKPATESPKVPPANNGTDGHGTTAPGTGDSPTTSSEVTTTTGDPTTDDSTTGTTASPPVQCTEIVIADPLLEEYLRQRLDVPEGPIPVELAESLDAILTDRDVASLSGLECFKISSRSPSTPPTSSTSARSQASPSSPPCGYRTARSPTSARSPASSICSSSTSRATRSPPSPRSPDCR